MVDPKLKLELLKLSSNSYLTREERVGLKRWMNHYGNDVDLRDDIRICNQRIFQRYVNR